MTNGTNDIEMSEQRPMNTVNATTDDLEVSEHLSISGRSVRSHGSGSLSIAMRSHSVMELSFNDRSANPVVANPFQVHADVDDEEASLGDDDSYFEGLAIADEHGDMMKSMVVRTSKTADDEGRKKELRQHHAVLTTGVECIKYLYAMALLAFSVAVVMACIFTEQTNATANMGLPGVAAFFVFWFLILWLAVMEGGQGCLVGLQSVEKEKYAVTHPRTLKNTRLVHKGDNMERFIVGRQFVVVLVITVINMMGGAVPGAQVFGLPQGVLDVFLGSGISMMITTIVIGQLTSQVNAASCSLDFINNYFMFFTSHLSLFIEFTGLLHSVYLVQIIFSKITGKPIESNEPARTRARKLFFWARVVASCALLGYAMAVTIEALFAGKTTSWEGLPPTLAVVVYFVLLFVVGLQEGMQIAMFAVIKMPEEELKHHSMVHKVCKLTFKGENLQAFLIGRQICVASCMFVVARMSTLNVVLGTGENIFGVPDWVQDLFNSGLLGAIVTTVIGSLAWRIIASSFPVAFLSNPLIYIIVRLCLLLEFTGICSASWVMARYQKAVSGYQPDEVYLEGAERHTGEPVTRRDKDIDRVFVIIKYTYSFALLGFSIYMVMYAMFEGKTMAATRNIPPIGAFFIFWFFILWLAMMEGGQGCLVGLKQIEKSSYSESHPLTYMNTKIAHRGDNLERFIIGRQFLVVLSIVVVNMMGAATPGVAVPGLPDWVNKIFYGSGIGMMLTLIMLGQLTSQINAAICMLDFINNYFMLITTYVSLILEFMGFFHFVYLAQSFFSGVTGMPIVSKEPTPIGCRFIFFWFRILMSTALLCFAFAVTIEALFTGKTTSWEGLSPEVTIVVYVLVLCWIGLFEGVQIALFAVVNMPEEELIHHKMAHTNCKLTFTGQNLQAFLIGRQITVACSMFVVARMTTLNVEKGEENIFGFGDMAQEFFNTGLLGALITTIVGSLIWRVTASNFPVAFLSNPLIYLVIKWCLFIEFTGVCSASWVLARYQKPLSGYQPDDVYLEGAERHTSAPVTRRDKDIDVMITVAKYGYSFGLLIFSFILIVSAMFQEATQISASTHPAVALVLFIFLLLWLAMMEGGQGCLVGLQPVDKRLYAESHPITLKNTTIAHKGDNMERFIIGRQFLVVLVIFLINMCGSAGGDTQLFNLPPAVISIFLANGLAMMITTIIVGQLTAQVNAATCMLDFINTYFMLFTTYISLVIEFIGFLHSVYLVQIIFSKITGHPIVSKEPPRGGLQTLFFWARVALSLAILGFALAVTMKAMVDGKTTTWEGTPPTVAIVVYFVLLAFVGLQEGMQIALFAVVNLPDETLKQYKTAYATCQVVFHGRNLPNFLIGRQICVASCMFIVASMSGMSVEVGTGENIFGLPDAAQTFLNTGLLGAVIATIIGSLAWRIIASSFSLAFLQNPLVYLIARLCLFLEMTGICSASWLLASLHKQIAGYDHDEFHIGSIEQREKKSRLLDEETMARVEAATGSSASSP